MTYNAQLKALAKLDGSERHQFKGDPYDRDCDICGCKPPHDNHQEEKNYCYSYDAIIPLLQKQPRNIRRKMREFVFENYSKQLMKKHGAEFTPFDLTPTQLCEALLHATKEWKRMKYES